MPMLTHPLARSASGPAHLALALLALALGAAGCAATLSHPHHEVTAGESPDGVQRVTVTAHSFWFEPDRVVVKAGVPVELTVRNGSLIVPHNFSCIAPETGVHVDQGVGPLHGSGHVRFTPTTPGEFRFFCDKDNHAGKGMTGTLVVVR